MSRFSNLFAAGIFIVFLAVLFHYFCRVRKNSSDMIVQQQIQVPEGYVYPITSNVNNAHTHQLVLAPNFGHMRPPPPFVSAANVPFPMNVGMGSGHPYGIPNNHTTGPPPGYPARNHLYSNPARPNQPDEDLPPPYHVAVANAPHSQ